MPKKRATTDEQAPVSEDRPLHAPAFDPPAPVDEPDEPPTDADDTNPKDVS